MGGAAKDLSHTLRAMYQARLREKAYLRTSFENPSSNRQGDSGTTALAVGCSRPPTTSARNLSEPNEESAPYSYSPLVGGLRCLIMDWIGLSAVPVHATVHEIVAQWCAGQGERELTASPRPD